jgi:flagellar basal body-associated protein FliL
MDVLIYIGLVLVLLGSMCAAVWLGQKIHKEDEFERQLKENETPAPKPKIK